MVDLDPDDVMSLKNASSPELVKAYEKLDWYFEYGPKGQRSVCLERLSNLLLEIRSRKIVGEHLKADRHPRLHRVLL